MKMIQFRRSGTFKVLCILMCFCIYYFIHKHVFSENEYYDGKTAISKSQLSDETSTNRVVTPLQPIVVAVVACESRLKEALNMIKSCLIFPFKLPLKFIVIADDDLIEDFRKTLKTWQTTLNDSFQYEVMPLQFPDKDYNQWRKLFKPCASQRLFLPGLLPNVDSLLYLDTDTVFLSPVEMVWSHFNSFNSSHMAALVVENEDPNISWYTRFAKHPFYGKLGVNSGVMLMNLTRMRSFRWEEYVYIVYEQWKSQLTWGDQDIINIIFKYHSDKLLLLDCSYNYRPDQCMYGSACQFAVKTGAKILHGSRGSFHSNKQPAFGAIYDAIDSYELGTNHKEFFLKPLLENLKNAQESNCGKVKDVFTKMPNKIFGDNNENNNNLIVKLL